MSDNAVEHTLKENVVSLLDAVIEFGAAEMKRQVSSLADELLDDDEQAELDKARLLVAKHDNV